jgi:hypothetical protein
MAGDKDFLPPSGAIVDTSTGNLFSVKMWILDGTGARIATADSWVNAL